MARSRAITCNICGYIFPEAFGVCPGTFDGKHEALEGAAAEQTARVMSGPFRKWTPPGMGTRDA